MPNTTTYELIGGGQANEPLVQRASWSFERDGGAVGIYSLASFDSSILIMSMVATNFLINVKTDFASGGSATINLGYTGAPTNFFASEDFDTFDVGLQVASAFSLDEGTPNTGKTNWPQIGSDFGTIDLLLEIETAALTAGEIEIIMINTIQYGV